MKRFSSYISAALAVLLLAISVLPASAATTTQLKPAPVVATPDSSAGLSIEPRKNYTINPGQTINDKITVGNLDNTSGLNLTLKVIDFTYTDQSGTPKLFLAANAPTTSWSLKPYTTLPKGITLSPGQTESINYSLTMPKNIGAGSYYSAIMYQSSSGSGGNVALGASGVTLVFVTVPGTVNENMTLKKFGAYRSTDNGVTGSYVSFTTSAPQMIAYTLQNSGDVTESPAGNLTLKNMFGHKINTLSTTNANQSLALIGQERLFATCIQSKQSVITSLGGTTTSPTAASTCVTPHLTPGLYAASLDVFYGQNGNATHEITGTAHFWYLPVWFIVLVIVILVIIIFAIWWGQRKIRGMMKGSTYHSGKGISRN
jgi:hypothetical protein